MPNNVDTAQIVTIAVALVGAIASVLAAAFSAINARVSSRTDWARSRLADTYAEVIRAAHTLEEIVSNWGGEECALDEEHPDEAPHYRWTEEGQEQLSILSAKVARLHAELEMFAPSYVVATAYELSEHMWFAANYHRLAHVEEILEHGSAEDRGLRVKAAIHKFVDAVRRDLGVEAAPATARAIRRVMLMPRMLWLRARRWRAKSQRSKP